MRIFIAGPCHPDSFQDNVRATLIEMGHEVRTMDVRHDLYFSLPARAARAVLHRIRRDMPGAMDLWVRHAALAFKPHLVLALTWDVHPQVLREIRAATGAQRALWWTDAPANSGSFGYLNPEWDAVFVKDEDLLQKLKLIGRTAHLLDEAMNPQWHRPVAARSNSSVAVVGSAYMYRQCVVEMLSQRGVPVSLYGSRPPAWSLESSTKAWTGEYVTRERKSVIFGSAMACLNTFHPTEGNSLNCRAFEVAGAGGLQLIEHRSALERCFEPGMEVLAFADQDGLFAALERARDDIEGTTRVRAAGARRALHEHTYTHRLRSLLSALERTNS